MTNMKIVKFADGTYAVRRWTLFGYEYLDDGIIPGWETHWWSHSPIRVAQMPSYEKAVARRDEYLQRVKKRKDKGTVVKE